MFMSGIMTKERAARMLHLYADQVSIAKIKKVHLRLDMMEYRPKRKKKVNDAS